MRIVCVVTLAAMVFPTIARAQVKAKDSPAAAVGLYAEIGLQNEYIPGDASFNNATLMLGAYVALPRIRLEPGLDFRCFCGDNGVQGLLVGPRFSTRIGPLRPYGEAVIGPAHALGNTSLNSVGQLHGITTQGVVGLDLERPGFVHWRIVDVAFGSFTGISGSTPVTVSTGIVVRFP